MMRKILVTGGAGFIGSNLIGALLKSGEYQVTCIDNFDNFYDRKIKEANINSYFSNSNFKFHEIDILNYDQLTARLTGDHDIIVHLAAKAGVGPSVKDPVTYQEVNIIGTQNLLELARIKNIKQFVFASSSSVYGVNSSLPWTEDDKQLQPISPYAASKISAELLGHTYSYLYGIRFIALRFFTVYGPRQRPDLAIHKFAKMLVNNEPITIYGDGTTGRDYTYIDDILSGVISAMNYEGSMYEIFNLGNSDVVELKQLIQSLEKVFDKKAEMKYLPNQEGDVPVTYASIEKAKRLLNYNPKTNIVDGLIGFKEWFYNKSK